MEIKLSDYEILNIDTWPSDGLALSFTEVEKERYLQEVVVPLERIPAVIKALKEAYDKTTTQKATELSNC